MTPEQEQLITLLFVKHSGLQGVVDMWMCADEKLSTEENEAIGAWLVSDKPKPRNLTVHNKSKYQYLSLEIPLDTLDKD